MGASRRRLLDQSTHSRAEEAWGYSLRSRMGKPPQGVVGGETWPLFRLGFGTMLRSSRSGHAADLSTRSDLATAAFSAAMSTGKTSLSIDSLRSSIDMPWL